MIGNVRSADGVLVRYETVGRGVPALVLVHGWSCDRGYWRHQVQHFADRCSVVTVDLAGHGESGTGRRAWTMGAFGEDVVAVLEALSLHEVILVGHSMGGDVVVEAARHSPRRVLGLVWVDTYRTLGEPAPDDAVREETAAFMAPFREDFVSATRTFVQRLFGADADPDLVERVAADMAAAPPEIALDAMERSVTNQTSTTIGLREARMPAVAINPEWPPTDVGSLVRHGVRPIVVPGVGHFVMMEGSGRIQLVAGARH